MITPTYNRAHLIGRALDSLLAQTYQDFEIIVVDDGSTDDTRQVLSRYGDRIRYVFQENAGPSAARNRGIRMAKGEYLAFLDSDDAFLPTKLALQVAYLEAHPEVGVVYSGWQIIGPDGTVQSEVRPIREGAILKDLLLEGYLFPPIAAVVRRACIDQVGLFDESLRVFEDPDLWFRVARAGYRFGCIEQPLCRYRMTPNSLGKDLPKLGQAVPIVLNKFFSDPDLPDDIAALEDEAYARRYLSFSMNYYYASNDTELRGKHSIARQYLVKAISLKPDILMGQHEFLDLIPHKAIELSPTNPAAHVRRVASTLFSRVGNQRRLQSRLLGRLHAILAFRAYEAGYRAQVVRHVLLGWRYDPSGLKNRGLVSILLRSFIGKSGGAHSNP